MAYRTENRKRQTNPHWYIERKMLVQAFFYAFFYSCRFKLSCILKWQSISKHISHSGFGHIMTNTFVMNWNVDGETDLYIQAQFTNVLLAELTQNPIDPLWKSHRKPSQKSGRGMWENVRCLFRTLTLTLLITTVMNWNTDDKTDLHVQHQYLTSRTFFWLNWYKFP